MVCKHNYFYWKCPHKCTVDDVAQEKANPERLTRQNVQAMIDAAVAKEREQFVQAINYAYEMSTTDDVAGALQRILGYLAQS